ncbi:CPBP family intramembrane glutamic endopeptidase [Paenibacillus beijingensis]|uniref:CAAX prenyl protease 2/Lysostaphin resistance protein A-like domain-containing protein n=1 Tax=Paenibacillus beijingensis TaxID=1126833 RepID=A0A0D5NLA9_9BACL|nr:CPBP family intramembrane glutamic endopeptidase [Paenibacillus beijingensis]AJY75787.1 hypothetical protein VN24_16070 [Paenibacillus beijingensis]
MQHNRLQADIKRYFWIGIIGAILFVLIQILPSTADSFFTGTTGKTISKSSAELKAAAFAGLQFGQAVVRTHAVYQSDSVFYGYLSREGLLDDFAEKYEDRFPTDTFQIAAELGNGETAYIYIHMTKGTVVGWHLFALERNTNTTLTGSKLLRAARSEALNRGFTASELEIAEAGGDPSVQVLKPKDGMIGQAKLQLHIRAQQTASGSVLVTRYEPVFNVPSEYVAYVKRQDRLADLLSIGGSLLLSAVLFILAIVYAALYRKHTSFKRGWLISAIFLAFYVVNNLNMMDGIRASMGESLNAELYAIIAVTVTMGITLLLGASCYFSLVAGDGLWRAMGRSLWPRAGESDYGSVVWNSMKLAYIFAFIVMGLQSVVLIVLQQTTGAWSTTDVTQSTYNFAYPFLLPLLAWCAAIQEEAVYRLFGIGLMRKWLRSPFVASLIPTVIWALGHVTYPIYPSTTRLIEVTLLGLLFSFIFLRYGFITAVFTHAIMDSVLMSSSLFFLGSVRDIIAGIVYILAPVGVAWLLRKYSGSRTGSPTIA